MCIRDRCTSLIQAQECNFPLFTETMFLYACMRPDNTLATVLDTLDRSFHLQGFKITVLHFKSCHSLAVWYMFTAFCLLWLCGRYKPHCYSLCCLWFGWAKRFHFMFHFFLYFAMIPFKQVTLLGCLNINYLTHVCLLSLTNLAIGRTVLIIRST